MQARDRLWTAVSKSRGSETEALVRAIARACLLVPGFRACAAGYLTPPASYSRVAWFIRNDCPEYEFTDDFENSITSSTGNQNGEHDNDDAYSDDKSDSDDDYTDAQHDSDDDYTDAQYDSDEASSDQDSAEEGWTLTDLLELKQCQRYFTILHNPNSSQPWVSANWQALVNKPHLKKVQDVLPIVHTVPFHPDNPAFPKYCSKLTTTQPAASSAAQVRTHHHIDHFLSCCSALLHPCSSTCCVWTCAGNFHYGQDCTEGSGPSQNCNRCTDYWLRLRRLPSIPQWQAMSCPGMSDHLRLTHITWIVICGAAKRMLYM